MSNIGSLQVTYRNVADIALAMKKFQEKAMPSMSQYQQILININVNSQEGLTNQNIRNYFVDVHSLINGTILTIFDAITSIINLYAYDLEKYDGSKEFIVIQEELEKKYLKYQHISDTFSNNHVIIQLAYDSISEYIDEGLLDVSNITSRLEEMHSFFERLYQEIHDEGSSYGAKLMEINDLLHKLQIVIDKAKQIEITTYDISKLAEIPHVSDLTNGVMALDDFLKANTKELAQAAYSLESYQRLKDAEAKRKSLILDIVIAVAGAVASVTAVILTGGAAVFVLVPAIAVTTAVDVGFKVSDVVENESVIHKSRENDMSRGYNPIRETLFNGNQESYDQAKRCASTVSQATQFAAGFAGGVGLVGGLKTTTTAAQKGMVFLKAGGRVFAKVGKEIVEGYVEDTVIPGIASATSEFILMQSGYTRDQAKAMIGDKVDVSMKLLGLGGSVRSVVSGVHEYKTARDDLGVTLPGKNRKRKSINELELERKKKCDTTNIKDIKNRLLDSKNESKTKNKVSKAKTDVDGKTKKNVGKDKSDRHNVKKHEKDLDPQYTDKVKNIPPEEKIPYDEKYINGDGYIEIDDSFYNRPISVKELDLVNSMNSTKTKVDKINMPANIHDFPLEAIVHLDNEGLRKFEKAYTYDEIKAYVDNMPDLQPGSKYVAKQDGSNYKQGEVRRFTHSKQQMDVMMEKIYNRDNVDGKLSEPYSDREIHWKPGDERYNVVDLGHDAGHEFKKTSLLYKKGLISDKQFKSFENDLSHFHIENSSANRSHAHEE